MFNVEEIVKAAVDKAVEPLDQALPDGFVQGLVGDLMVAIGEGIAEAGAALAGPENEDGDG